MLAATRLAHAAGQPDWVRELAENALAATSDPELRMTARMMIGWSLLWSDRNAEALDTLLSVAADALLTHPAIAWDAAGLTAILVHQSGLPEVRAKVRAALRGLDAAGAEVPNTGDWPAGIDEARLWMRACTDPFDDRTETVSYLERMAGRALCDPGKVRCRRLEPGRNRARGPGAAPGPHQTARSRCPRRQSAPSSHAWNGPAPIADAGTRHSPPPGRQPISPPPTRWPPSPPTPTWSLPPSRPCAVSRNR